MDNVLAKLVNIHLVEIHNSAFFNRNMNRMHISFHEINQTMKTVVPILLYRNHNLLEFEYLMH
jgi:hypothetical protein